MAVFDHLTDWEDRFILEICLESSRTYYYIVRNKLDDDKMWASCIKRKKWGFCTENKSVRLGYQWVVNWNLPHFRRVSIGCDVDHINAGYTLQCCKPYWNERFHLMLLYSITSESSFSQTVGCHLQHSSEIQYHIIWCNI